MKPVKIEENGDDVIVLTGTCDQSSSNILYRLELSMPHTSFPSFFPLSLRLVDLAIKTS